MDEIAETSSKKEPSSWEPIFGSWNFNGSQALFSGPSQSVINSFPVGLALCNLRLRSGVIKTRVKFTDITQKDDFAGRIAFGFHSETKSYFSVGLGGYGFAYVLSEFEPGKGWRGIETLGSKENIQTNKFHNLEVLILGQKIKLIVNDVEIFEKYIPRPLQGSQIGIFGWGEKTVSFENFNVCQKPPKAFVVMQFGEPFDTLYEEVIKPMSNELGFEACRADDVFKPGIILNDIIDLITEAEIVIAEITPANKNVFYELGYAHALNKQTILLAGKESELPFDIQSHRCIFYEDSIKGKQLVADQFKNHLNNIRRDF